MTKSVLILPSDLYREAAQAKLLRKELDEKDAAISEMEANLAEKDASLAEKDAIIANLQKQLLGQKQ